MEALARRLADGTSAAEIKAEFEQSLAEAEAQARDIVELRGRLRDWLADAIERLGEDQAKRLAMAEIELGTERRRFTARDDAAIAAAQAAGLREMEIERRRIHDQVLRQITRAQYRDRSRDRTSDEERADLARQMSAWSATREGEK